eukprot:CAMPEP_0119378446 /NCGR_PEP_ID=MMETSP1334-20130426/48358_1 /TAXON_ID=127549 /ORGANISM="Calcidiscus leptoporus, Strain RCC1130" /LENGTH=165 /DNA_ID=CAMNT_0007397651 /DNA_START=62 /DNA_END=555 /DNA_ORIENTATION=-
MTVRYSTLFALELLTLRDKPTAPPWHQHAFIAFITPSPPSSASAATRPASAPSSSSSRGSSLMLTQRLQQLIGESAARVHRPAMRQRRVVPVELNLQHATSLSTAAARCARSHLVHEGREDDGEVGARGAQLRVSASPRVEQQAASALARERAWRDGDELHDRVR